MITALFCLLGAILFGLGAIWNGFPLLYYDSVSYIYDGFSNSFISVRPVTYALGVRVFSLSGISLWDVVFVQNLALSFLVWRVQVEVGKNRSRPLFLLICLACSVVLGATWVQSQIMADALTPVFILSFLLLGLADQRPPASTALIGALFLISGLAHASHLVIAGLTFVVMLAASRASAFRRSSASLRPLGSWVLTLFILSPVLNFSFHGAFKPVDSYQPALLGSLAESGLLNRLLAEKCPEKHYLFCADWL